MSGYSVLSRVHLTRQLVKRQSTCFVGPVLPTLRAAHFWLHSLSLASKSEWQDVIRIAGSAICKTISRDELFRRVYAKAARVASQIGLDRMEAFGDGAILTDSWNDFRVMWETAEDYVAFHWDTTA